jgi:deoxyribonuclease V
VGEYKMPGVRRGCRTRLVHKGRTVGYALRTRDGVKPVFVSPGHMADLKSSAALALSCCTRYRLPEPSREAHRLSNLARSRAQT